MYIRIWDGDVLDSSDIGLVYAGGTPSATPTFWFPMSEVNGPEIYNIVDGASYTMNSPSGIETQRARRQNVFHANMLRGCSKVVHFDGANGYAETDILPDSETEIEIDMVSHSASGLHGFTRSPGGVFVMGFSGGNIYVQAGDAADNSIPASEGLGKHTWKINKNGFYLDGVERVTWSPNFTGGFYGGTIVLGARSVNGSIASYAPCNMIWAKISNNGTLQRHYVAKVSYGCRS